MIPAFKKDNLYGVLFLAILSVSSLFVQRSMATTANPIINSNAYIIPTPVDYSGRGTPTTSAQKLSSVITWSGNIPTVLEGGLLCSISNTTSTGSVSFGDTSAVTTTNGYTISNTSTLSPTPHWSGNVNSLNEYVISSDGATQIMCHGN